MVSVRVHLVAGGAIPSIVEHPERTTTYPRGVQELTTRDGVASSNWPACAVTSIIEDRLIGRRLRGAWFGDARPMVGQVHYDTIARIWFIEVTRFNPPPGEPIRYLEITPDEAAAWLESHGYRLPDLLKPSLRLDGIAHEIAEANGGHSATEAPAVKASAKRVHWDIADAIGALASASTAGRILGLGPPREELADPPASVTEAPDGKTSAPPASGTEAEPQRDALNPAALAIAGAYELKTSGKPVSLKAACERAGVDRKNIQKRHPEVAKAIRAMSEPDRTIRPGTRDRRTGTADGVDGDDD